MSGTTVGPHLIGGNGGSPFRYVGGTDGGKVLTRLEVWAATSRIKAVRVWLTDDEQGRLFGDPSPPVSSESRYKDFTFQTGEHMTSLSLWGNGVGTRLGWIYFHTNHGRTFDYGMYDWGKQTEYKMEIGSGICLGVQGRCGSDIDCMGFIFIKPIRYASIVNVKYPQLSLDAAGITPQTLKEFQETNNTDNDLHWEFSGSREVTNSSSWSLETGLTVGLKYSVSAELPLVASVDVGWTWELSVTRTQGSSTSTTEKLEWKNQGTLHPHQSVTLRAVTGTGTINTEYTGTVELTLSNYEVFSYPVRGQYLGVSYSGVKIA